MSVAHRQRAGEYNGRSGANGRHLQALIPDGGNGAVESAPQHGTANPMKTSPERRPDVIPAAEAGTLPGLFRKRVEQTPDLTAYRQFDASRGEWLSFTWKDASALVGRWQRSLSALGLAPAERVAVQLRQSLMPKTTVVLARHPLPDAKRSAPGQPVERRMAANRMC